MSELPKAQMDAIEKQINADGSDIAATAISLGAGSPDIALAILGVAVGKVIEGIDETKRTETLREWLASFEDTDA